VTAWKAPKPFDYRLDAAGFDSTFGSLPIGGLLVDIDGEETFRIRAINKWLERHLGLQPGKTAGLSLQQVPVGLGQLSQPLAECHRSGERVMSELSFLRPDGPRHLAISLVPLRDATDTIRQVVGIVIDLIERNRLRQLLRQSEQRYRRLVGNVSEGIFQSAPEAYFLNVNDVLAEMLGYEDPEQVLDELTDLVGQFYVDPEQHARFVHHMETSDSLTGAEYQVRRRDGRVI